MATQQQLLLLKDVEPLGRSGDIVKVRPGYARNFLLPQGLAIVANPTTLRLQERLKEERKQRALLDRQEAEQAAAKIDGISLTQIVKVDQEGHMYGSVSVADIADLIAAQSQVEVDRRSVQLKHPIKETGSYNIVIRFKEGVNATVSLTVASEEPKASEEEKEDKRRERSEEKKKERKAKEA